MRTIRNLLSHFPILGYKITTITSFNTLKQPIIILLLFVLNSCGVIKDNSTIKPTNDFLADKIEVWDGTLIRSSFLLKTSRKWKQ
jgi:hypothetical protein